MNKILIVDDDKNIRDVLRYNLVRESYSVATAEDGIKALELARLDKPDLIILDLMLPGIDGFEICRVLRKEMSVPILMLTAKAEETDKVVGLELGADDYMTKPFSVRELLARIRAFLRRTQLLNLPTFIVEKPVPPVLRAGNIEVDVQGHRVFRNGLPVPLSPKEFELLSFLAQHRGQVFNRVHLIERIWGNNYTGTDRTVDAHIRALRKKIEDNPEKPEHLITVHGFGYKFE